MGTVAHYSVLGDPGTLNHSWVIGNCPQLAVALAAMTPLAVDAHHFGAYDEDRVVTIEGVIAQVDWVNPHLRVLLDVAEDDAVESRRWTIAGTSVNVLERWGVGREALIVGDRLRATGPRSRLDRFAIVGAVAEIVSGRQVFLWPSVAKRLALTETSVDGLFPPPAQRADRVAAGSATAAGIFRVWTPREIPPVPAADQLPLRPEARARLADYNPLIDDPVLRCEPPGMPVLLGTEYPVQFVDLGDRIGIRYEEWDVERTIWMRPGGGPAVQEHALHGTSFGRWEGETLAIFTLYVDYPYFDRRGTPQSRDVTVLERYTPVADATRLDWAYTVTDAASFTESIERVGYYAWEQGEIIKPFDCRLPEN